MATKLSIAHPQHLDRCRPWLAQHTTWGAAEPQHDHPCWRAKRSHRPHKVVQAVERNTETPIHITKKVKNESQELRKRMGIFYLHVTKHGCLQPWNKFHGRNQLQLGTGPCFHVYFTGLNGFVMLHGTPKKQPAPWLTPSQLSSCLLE